MYSTGMILLKGEPRTQEVSSMNQDRKGVYWVKFKSSKSFPYAHRDVCVLQSAKMIDPNDIKISKHGGIPFNPVHIWVFKHLFHKYYRLEYPNGSVAEYDGKHLAVTQSALADESAKSIFTYLTSVSATQPIMTENGPISLHDKYAKVDFIDENSALASFLYGKTKTNGKGYDSLLYPFYSNLSQMQAVDSAFKSQISVIQGPPGTGKTQTILNIIANIVSRKMSVLIVSNNNSAVENVKEKLEKEGLGFIVAQLGKAENQEKFLGEGQTQYPDMRQWEDASARETVNAVIEVSKELKSIFEKQNQLAQDRQELLALNIEQEHFLKENSYDSKRIAAHKRVSSETLMRLWVKLEIKSENEANAKVSFWKRIVNWFKQLFLSSEVKKVFGKEEAQKDNELMMLDIKALFYVARKEELKNDIAELESYLKDKHADELLKKQAKLSMKAFKAALFKIYDGGKENKREFDKNDLWKNSDEVAKEYPVVLSTTFSAMSALPNHTFDYVIMDEASQVPVESGALALLRAKNAVIVGDMKQLPNIMTDEMAKQMKASAVTYNIDEKYDCTSNSFLSTVLKVFQNVPQTLLREHYRCAPMIINFCNQKFYGGELIIMTKADDETTPMKVIQTVKGHHSRYIENGDKIEVTNQREVDEFCNLLKSRPNIPLENIGIITPYCGQALLFRQAVNDNRLEADTIHKYQGREKDIIVMSTVADTYNDFVNNANLINVAVSRAKKEFVLITNGNENASEGNIQDLVGYINYNHGKIVKSNLHSIFDLLYASYTEQREKYLQGKSNVSDYDSENIAYHVIEAILKRNDEMSSLEVIPHYHLSNLIQDVSLLTEEECKFVRASWSHVDFLIENRVSKTPVLVVEVDGFTYHHKGTKQSERDQLKDSVLKKYNIPLLRLSTAGSGEVNKIEALLKERL